MLSYFLYRPRKIPYEKNKLHSLFNNDFYRHYHYRHRTATRLFLPYHALEKFRRRTARRLPTLHFAFRRIFNARRRRTSRYRFAVYRPFQSGKRTAKTKLHPFGGTFACVFIQLFARALFLVIRAVFNPVRPRRKMFADLKNFTYRRNIFMTISSIFLTVESIINLNTPKNFQKIYRSYNQ